ncbi:glycosyl hydrolase family 25 [Ruminococcus callidus ATCC 27760]|mgnify:FL=1|uniref:Glycosyl hydrolase family 25 n=1 Tax=Ruminococcus callidus ATCC 27760 TaxID=411473 RepID=U2KNZ4_9FIRM|nr:glycoside hydrolase family 25 protein [Ruminococcus callidus]ERJ93997.1 glycosyl hydrolase family 25 [Ruminococcus callidus ATCC 27760]
MANKFFRKLNGLLTAAALCVSCLPFGGMLSASAADVQETIPGMTQSPEQLIQEADRGDFLTLGYAVMLECSYGGVGFASTLSEKNSALLDVDHSGAIDSADIFLLMYWCAYFGAYGKHTDEALAFLQEWDAANGNGNTETTQPTTVPVATATTTLTETTTAILSTFPPVPETATDSSTASASAESKTTPAESMAVTSLPASSTTTKATTKATTTLLTTTAAPATTTVTTTQTASGAWAQKDSYRGIDVSKYQGNIDWNAVKAAGNDFAIIRAGYGKYASQKDPYFEQNMRNAKAAGVACGAYWYSYAVTPAEAKQEAEVFASIVQGYQFEYPLVLDIEDSTQTKLSKEQVSAIIQAFCDTMESKGYYISLYSYASFLNSYVYQSVLEDYDIWVAHFGVSRPSYSKTSYGMWQYSSTGSVSGISGNVDLDYSYKCYPNLMTKYHLNGF